MALINYMKLYLTSFMRKSQLNLLYNIIARKINLSYIHFPISLTVGMTIAVIFFTVGFMVSLPKELVMVLYLLYVVLNFIFFEQKILKLIKQTLHKFGFNSIFLISAALCEISAFSLIAADFSFWLLTFSIFINN